MKAVAKRDIQFSAYDYVNFINGNKYEFIEKPDLFTTDFMDEKNNSITLCGDMKSLKDIFDFVEE